MPGTAEWNSDLFSFPNVVNIKRAVVEPLQLGELKAKGVEADVLRLDKIHPVISGNKWFKLKNYLQEAALKKIQTLVSFGGPWSNHIVATAYAAQASGFQSIGIIRGERQAPLPLTLQRAEQFGMQLKFISRFEYRKKTSPASRASLLQEYPGCLLIAEGGAGEPGIRGSGEILDLVEKSKYSHILCAVGTGTMFLGLAIASVDEQQVTGICILKGMRDGEEGFKVTTDLRAKTFRGILYHDYHFGGYAKKTPELLDFMNMLYTRTDIPTDFVYTGKLFYAAIDMVRKNRFSSGSKLLIIHSGGLQGNMSLPTSSLLF